MTADRIDHAAEALRLMARAEKQGSDALGDTLRLDAFVHSTLAVAEQQRIANLIALLTVTQIGGHDEADLKERIREAALS